MKEVALTSRTCITQRNVCFNYIEQVLSGLICIEAKKEDTPEEALNAFRAIVDQETVKGDW